MRITTSIHDHSLGPNGLRTLSRSLDNAILGGQSRAYFDKINNLIQEYVDSCRSTEKTKIELKTQAVIILSHSMILINQRGFEQYNPKLYRSLSLLMEKFSNQLKGSFEKNKVFIDFIRASLQAHKEHYENKMLIAGYAYLHIKKDIHLLRTFLHTDDMTSILSPEQLMRLLVWISFYSKIFSEFKNIYDRTIEQLAVKNSNATHILFDEKNPAATHLQAEAVANIIQAHVESFIKGRETVQAAWFFLVSFLSTTSYIDFCSLAKDPAAREVIEESPTLCQQWRTHLP